MKIYGDIENIGPIYALSFANERWNVCKNKEFYYFLLNVVKKYKLFEKTIPKEKNYITFNINSLYF